MHELTVGQELWFVPHERGREKPRALKVMKVGRKWAEVGFTIGLPDNKNYGPHSWGRIDVKTLWADGGQYISPGRCWASREAWEAEKNRQATWRALRSKFERQGPAPDGMSEDAMRQIEALLDVALTGDRSVSPSERTDSGCQS